MAHKDNLMDPKTVKTLTFHTSTPVWRYVGDKREKDFFKKGEGIFASLIREEGDHYIAISSSDDNLSYYVPKNAVDITDYKEGRTMAEGGIIAIGKMPTPDGEITGKVVYNDYWRKYQVNIDGVIYEEFNTKEEAIENLRNAGFKNIEKVPFGGSMATGGITVIDFQKSISDIANFKDLPYQVQEVIKSSDTISSTGFSELLGYDSDGTILWSAHGAWWTPEEVAEHKEYNPKLKPGFAIDSFGAGMLQWPSTKMATGGSVEDQLAAFSRTNPEFLALQAEADKYFREKERLEDQWKTQKEKNWDMNTGAIEQMRDDAIVKMHKAHDASMVLLKNELRRLNPNKMATGGEIDGLLKKPKEVTQWDYYRHKKSYLGENVDFHKSVKYLVYGEKKLDNDRTAYLVDKNPHKERHDSYSIGIETFNDKNDKSIDWNSGSVALRDLQSAKKWFRALKKDGTFDYKNIKSPSVSMATGGKTGEYQVKYVGKRYFVIYKFSDGEEMVMSHPYSTEAGAEKAKERIMHQAGVSMARGGSIKAQKKEIIDTIRAFEEAKREVKLKDNPVLHAELVEMIQYKKNELADLRDGSMAGGGTIQKVKIKSSGEYATVKEDKGSTVVTDKGVFGKNEVTGNFQVPAKYFMKSGGKTNTSTDMKSHQDKIRELEEALSAFATPEDIKPQLQSKLNKYKKEFTDVQIQQESEQKMRKLTRQTSSSKDFYVDMDKKFKKKMRNSILTENIPYTSKTVEGGVFRVFVSNQYQSDTIHRIYNEKRRKFGMEEVSVEQCTGVVKKVSVKPFLRPAKKKAGIKSRIQVSKKRALVKPEKKKSGIKGKIGVDND